MGNFLIFESSNNVVDAINISDVTQEVVAQSLPLRGSLHDTCNINNLQDSRDF
jgi:hypothetical protein